MATTNPTPNQVYVSNSVPFGGFFANFYRGDGAPVLLGTYRVMSYSPQRGANTTDRPDIDGGNNGWFIVTGVIEGGITVQLPLDSSTTLQPGDFFKTSVIFRNAGDAQVSQIVVLKEIGINIDSSVRVQSGTARVDAFAQTASPANWAIAEYAPA